MFTVTGTIFGYQVRFFLLMLLILLYGFIGYKTLRPSTKHGSFHARLHPSQRLCISEDPGLQSGIVGVEKFQELPGF